METNNPGLLRQVWDFLRIRKRWWLLPLILFLALVSVLVIISQSSSLSAFIYALF